MSIDPGFAADLARDLPTADFLRVLALFRIDVERLTAEIETAAHVGQHEAVRRSAHALAGAAGAVSATALEATSRVVMRQKDSDMDLGQIARTIRLLSDEALLNIDTAIARAGEA